MHLKIQLKLGSVHLRLKQQLPIQFAIKKGQENIFLPYTCVLENCNAHVNSSLQFEVPIQKPYFQIYVMLVWNGDRKFVGVVAVNLRELQQGVWQQVTRKLDKSPDKEAVIQFQIVYRTIYEVYQKEEEMGQNMGDNMQEVADEIQTSNNNLQIQNKKLSQQLQALKKTNASLRNNHNDATENFQKCISNYEQRHYKLSTTQNTCQDSIVQHQSTVHPTNSFSIPTCVNTNAGNQNPKVKIVNQQQFMNSMEEKMVKLKQLVDKHGKEDIRDRVQDIFKMQ